MTNHPTAQRDHGLDLLRIVAMGMIVLHHLLTHGGLLFAFPHFSASGMAVHLLNALTLCAVNAYALISGYVMSLSRVRPARLMLLWLEVVFWGLAIALGLHFSGLAAVTAGDLLAAALPVSHSQYWYFTAYAVLFVCLPMLNAILRRLPRQTLLLSLGAVLGCTTVLPLFGGDPLGLGGGYHPAWIVLMYLLGGAARLHGFGRLRKWALPLFALCVILAAASRLLFLRAGRSDLAELLLHYTSPTMVLCALALMMLFAQRSLPAWVQRAVAALAPLTFGVYLLHDNPLVREHLLRMQLSAWSSFAPAKLAACLLACWAAVYAGCLLLEWLRSRLFALLHIPALCNRCETLIRRCFRVSNS